MENRKLLPANNLIELFQNLTPSQYLDKNNAEMRVPLYEKQLKELRLKLLYSSNNHQTLYVTGQAGSGKTTALNFLPNEEINEKFIVEYLFGDDISQDLNDLEITDLLLMLSFKLVENCEEIQPSFEYELTKIKEKLKGRIEEINEEIDNTNSGRTGSMGFGLNFNPLGRFLNIFHAKSSFSADYKKNRETRKLVRKIFQPDLPDLVKLTNTIIAKYLDTKSSDNKKQLLIIFHELNHMRGLENIKSLFINNVIHLEGINAQKVITIPPSLILQPLYSGKTKVLNIKVSKKPKALGISKKDKSDIVENTKILKSILQKRMVEESDFIAQKAVENAINYSGGNIRQFISILHNATLNTLANEEDKIQVLDVDKGASEDRKHLEYQLIAMKYIKMLDYVRRHNSPFVSDEDNFNTAILANHVFAYENDRIWFNLNPLIIETVKLYAQKFAHEEAQENKG